METRTQVVSTWQATWYNSIVAVISGYYEIFNTKNPVDFAASYEILSLTDKRPLCK